MKSWFIKIYPFFFLPILGQVDSLSGTPVSPVKQGEYSLSSFQAMMKAVSLSLAEADPSMLGCRGLEWGVEWSPRSAPLEGTLVPPMGLSWTFLSPTGFPNPRDGPCRNCGCQVSKPTHHIVPSALQLKYTGSLNSGQGESSACSNDTSTEWVRREGEGFHPSATPTAVSPRTHSTIQDVLSVEGGCESGWGKPGGSWVKLVKQKATGLLWPSKQTQL